MLSAQPHHRTGGDVFFSLLLVTDHLNNHQLLELFSHLIWLVRQLLTGQSNSWGLRIQVSIWSSTICSFDVELVGIMCSIQGYMTTCTPLSPMVPWVMGTPLSTNICMGRLFFKEHEKLYIRIKDVVIFLVKSCYLLCLPILIKSLLCYCRDSVLARLAFVCRHIFLPNEKWMHWLPWFCG